MWGAIIQAIDHALGRMHEGAGAGIKVANSQHGGGAPISNMDAKQTGEAARSLMQQGQDTTSEQDEAAEKAKIGSNATSTGEVPSEGGQGQGGAGALGSIGGGADAGASDAASSEGAADAASDILSDANAKTAENASSGSSLSGWRAYGAGVGQGMAQAGAIAQGKTPAKWEDINKDNAKNAAEKVVKGWKKRDFSKSPDEQQNTQPTNTQQGQ